MITRDVFQGERPGRSSWKGFKTVLTTYRAARAKTLADSRLSDEGKSADLFVARTRAEVDLENLADWIQRDIEAARADAQRRLARPAPDAVALLTDMQLARRMERLLDSGASVLDLAQSYAEARDLPALRVLRAEAPSLLAARRAPKGEVADTLTAIDKFTRPLLPFAEACAVGDLEAADWQESAFKTNAAFAAEEVGGGAPATVLVDGAVVKGSIAIGAGA